MFTSDWQPENASFYMTLSWDYDGSILTPKQVFAVTFSLTVDMTIHDIYDFAFNVTVVATGVD
jgi:hypothetical protein